MDETGTILLSRCQICIKKIDKVIERVMDHPTLVHYFTLTLLALTTWVIILATIGRDFYPGTQLFSLLALFVLAFAAGVVTEFMRLPALSGMLLMGFLLRNVGFIHLRGVYTEIAAILREIALFIALTKVGLLLDPKVMTSLRYTILRLAFIPGIVEVLISMVVSHFLLEFPWMWGLLLGAILAAVSPAVVIPCLFSLQEKGYGIGKGIPTLVVAATSLDDIMTITLFGIVFNVIFRGDKNVTMQVIEAPVEILIRILFGVVWGFITYYVPHKKDKYVVLLRVLMMSSGGLMAVMGSKFVGFEGGGPLGCILAAFVTCLGWRRQGYSNENNPVADVFQVFWFVFQPILFGLIGSEVDLTQLELSTVANGMLTLLCSLVGRTAATVLVFIGAGFNWKEKIFIALAWLPKATLQAALAPFALDYARGHSLRHEVAYAEKILVVAVLGILLTAPMGAVLITYLGRELLTKDTEPRQGQVLNGPSGPVPVLGPGPGPDPGPVPVLGPGLGPDPGPVPGPGTGTAPGPDPGTVPGPGPGPGTVPGPGPGPRPGPGPGPGPGARPGPGPGPGARPGPGPGPGARPGPGPGARPGPGPGPGPGARPGAGPSPRTSPAPAPSPGPGPSPRTSPRPTPPTAEPESKEEEKRTENP